MLCASPRSSHASYPQSVKDVLRHDTPSIPAARPVVPYEQTFAGGGSVRLKLATGHLEVNGQPPWEMNFDDPEQTASLHRWGWLLSALAEPSPGIRSWGIGLMRSWIERKGESGQGLPWDPYTTSERISNALLFLVLAKDQTEQEVPEDLARSLLVMAAGLTGHLEYVEGGESTNHVINNARALSLAGHVLRQPSFVDLAAAMLRNDLPRLVTSEGFLREGSSHYHFLVTRWLLEMLWIARRGEDSRIREIIEPVAASMVRRCWYFLVCHDRTRAWSMPTIGDISPDCPWQWLQDLPWSGEAARLSPPQAPRPAELKGWARLFGTTDSAGNGAPKTSDPSFQSFPASGWYRLDWKELTILWHVEPNGAPPFASHGHCDIGSCSLFWRGLEVLTDPGRMNYQESDPVGAYGLSARAHSSVLIDGLEPFIYHRRFRFPSAYRRGRVDVSWALDDHLRLTIRHMGFARLYGDPVTFSRTFLAWPDRLEIVDTIKGGGRHRVETSFQWGSGMTVSAHEGGFRIAAPEFTAAFEPAAGPAIHWRQVRGASGPNPGGWTFPGYGEKQEACTLIGGADVSLPVTARYVLEFQGASAGHRADLEKPAYEFR